jgi:NAD(P)-dependent dehydrogenase (short-subunit alcohol dehydrogenase family)
VRGLEVEKEYNVRPDTEGSPVAVYLLKIAEKKLSQSDIRKINALINDKKEKEAFDYIKNSDQWVRRQFETNVFGVLRTIKAALPARTPWR